jgi:hypothetical protein
MPHLPVVVIEAVGEHLTEQTEQLLLPIPRNLAPTWRRDCRIG